MHIYIYEYVLHILWFECAREWHKSEHGKNKSKIFNHRQMNTAAAAVRCSHYAHMKISIHTVSHTLLLWFFFFLFSQSNVIRILIPKKTMLQQNARSVHNSWPNCNTVLADYRETQWMLRLNWIYVYDVYVYSRNQQLQRSALTANKNVVEKDDTKERELGRDFLRLFFFGDC